MTEFEFNAKGKCRDEIEASDLLDKVKDYFLGNAQTVEVEFNQVNVLEKKCITCESNMKCKYVKKA